MRKFLFLIFFIGLQLSAQEMTLRKGMVVDSIKVSDSLDESFALYLPTEFKGEKNWPALFLFDSRGRGKSAAQLFKPAAQEQGYILASSNDIDPENTLAENAEIAARLLHRVSQMLPLDYRQVATAGSMEGAQVASSVPLIFKDVLGTIVVGDHWVNFDMVEKDKDFAFIGIVGDEQYTSTGINLTALVLEDMDFPSEVYVYEGKEDWPNPALITSAVGSLTTEAMRQRLRPFNRQLVAQLYEEDLNRVNKMISTGELVQAYSFLDLMESKYEELVDLSAVKQKQNQLERSRNFIRQRLEQEKISEKEKRLGQDFAYYIGEDIRTVNFENLGWWNYQKNQLDSLGRKGGAEGKMAERLKGYISELARLEAENLVEQDAPLERKLLANMIRTIFDPKDFEAYKNIISLSAIDNDFGTALFYLEEMLKHGFEDKAALYEIEGTLGLRLTKDYNEIIEKYLGSARFYDLPEK